MRPEIYDQLASMFRYGSKVKPVFVPSDSLILIASELSIRVPDGRHWFDVAHPYGVFRVTAV